MIYKEFLPNHFEFIPTGEKINARILELENNKQFKAFIFNDEPYVYSCILPVTDIESKLPEINGLKIQYAQYSMPISELKWYVLIECKNPAYLENYTQIIKEILSEVDAEYYDTVKCIQLVISKWRHFLSAPNTQIMSRENIIGLIGELILLDKLIESYNGDAVNFWVADSGEADFLFENKLIEVKSTIKNKHEHIINGLDQLLINPNHEKYILSLLFAETNDDLNIPSLINKCSLKLATFPVEFDLFFKKLKFRGYDHRDSNQYLDYQYKLTRGGYFQIDDSFPKLTNHQLNHPLPSRISKVRYTVDMEGLSNKDFENTPITEIL